MTSKAKMTYYAKYDTFLHNRMCHIKGEEQYIEYVYSWDSY